MAEHLAYRESKLIDEVWITREGKEIAIKTMTESHLSNTVRFITRRCVDTSVDFETKSILTRYKNKMMKRLQNDFNWEINDFFDLGIKYKEKEKDIPFKYTLVHGLEAILMLCNAYEEDVLAKGIKSIVLEIIGEEKND